MKAVTAHPRKPQSVLTDARAKHQLELQMLFAGQQLPVS